VRKKKQKQKTNNNTNNKQQNLSRYRMQINIFGNALFLNVYAPMAYMSTIITSDSKK
jgi:hypothetical protein